jgi:multidrug efflux pump subunit AcrB
MIERYNGQRVVSLTANLQGIAIGQAIGDLRAAIARAGEPPRGVTVALRGQVPPFETTERGLQIGLAMAVVAIFLLLAGYFQSVRLAMVVLGTIPAVLAGVVTMLAVTGTTLNVQSFMGAIMAMGIAVANAILIVAFAEERRREGDTVLDAARTAGAERLRAVLMTASAMIAGMLPMALGLGEGGATRRSAVRWGEAAGATVATLVIVPALYTLLQGRASRQSSSLNPMDPGSVLYEAP